MKNSNECVLGVTSFRGVTKTGERRQAVVVFAEHTWLFKAREEFRQMFPRDRFTSITIERDLDALGLKP